MGLLSNWIAKRSIGAALGAIKWKLIAIAAVAAVGYVTTLHVMLNIRASELRAAQAELETAAVVNQTATAAVAELEKANALWAAANAADAEKLAALKKETEDAKQIAERAQRELASRRQLDRQSPDCAALLDRSLAVCPDVGRRLREREAALGPG